MLPWLLCGPVLSALVGVDLEVGLQGHRVTLFGTRRAAALASRELALFGVPASSIWGF